LENTVKAYESVIEYFPDSKYWVGLAKQSLAMLYLERGYNDKTALEKAMELFQKFADVSPTTERGEIAFGLGGEALVLTFRQEPRESMKKLVELGTFLRDKCKPEERQAFNASPMGRKVQRIAENNRQAIDKKDLEQFNEVLESLTGGEPA